MTKTEAEQAIREMETLGRCLIETAKVARDYGLQDGDVVWAHLKFEVPGFTMEASLGSKSGKADGSEYTVEATKAAPAVGRP